MEEEEKNVMQSDKSFVEAIDEKNNHIMFSYSWNQKNQDSHVIEWSEKRHLTLIAIGAICTFFLGFYFDQFTEAKQPIVDSFTTVFSILATYMVIKKVLENWLYWIVVDLAAVYLYFSRDLHLTALLFIIYTLIAIFGYISWSKSIKNAN